MRVKAKRKEGESLPQFFKRFSGRFQKSGTVIEVKKNKNRRVKLNEREKKEYRLYRLKLQQFINEKMKQGMSFEKAYQMGKRYVKYIKYRG
jgi:DNA-binding transcriptional regulator YhcF (GntR family)